MTGFATERNPGDGARTRRYTHELVLSQSRDESVAAAVSAAREALEAGDPLVLSVAHSTAEGVLDVLEIADGDTGIQIATPDDAPRRPATELRRLREWTERLLGPDPRAGRRLRIVNELPVAPLQWREWCRYEAAANVGLEELPLTGVCIYDAGLPGEAIDRLRRAHPSERQDGSRIGVDRFDPVAVGWETFDTPPDPLEREEPIVTLVDPPLAAGRAAVHTGVGRAGLLPEDLEALVFATNEALTNALQHGAPPVTLRLWVTSGRAVVRVSDTGGGPRDCFVGIVPRTYGGGLWLASQLVDVAYSRAGAEYSVRLSASADATGRRMPRS